MTHWILFGAFPPWPRELTLAFLALALGAQSVYYLLPRTRPYPPLLGGAAAAMALLLVGYLCVLTGTMSAETILFCLFSGIAILAGGMLVTQQNPVRAALSFALVVLSTCGLFLLQAAPFLMAATIIVYAGAIIVTFLFVVMLAHQTGFSDADIRSREPLLSCVAGAVLLGAILYVLHTTYDTRFLDELLARAEAVRGADTVDGMRKALADEGPHLQAYLQEIQKQEEAIPTEYRDIWAFRRAFQQETQKFGADGEQRTAVARALDELEIQLTSPKPDDGLARKEIDTLLKLGGALRRSYGSLPPPKNLPLSDHSGLQANQANQARNAAGHLPMPAENVARLGVSLFTDFLLAVELGGTLLLVATVGAIAIAGRRPEGQR